MSIIAKRFLESWFYDVWVLSSVENMKRYYANSVTGEFNGEILSREELEKHCSWGKDNEKLLNLNLLMLFRMTIRSRFASNLNLLTEKVILKS